MVESDIGALGSATDPKGSVRACRAPESTRDESPWRVTRSHFTPFIFLYSSHTKSLGCRGGPSFVHAHHSPSFPCHMYPILLVSNIVT